MGFKEDRNKKQFIMYNQPLRFKNNNFASKKLNRDLIFYFFELKMTLYLAKN